MAIQRAPRPAQGFTVLRNQVIRDSRLSYRARGVLVTILSQPDHWKTDARTLERGGAEGRDAIRAALRELEATGYLVRQRVQDDRGRWSTASIVYDDPQAAPEPVQETLEAVGMDAKADGLPTPGIPAVGSPTVGPDGAKRSTNVEVPRSTASAADAAARFAQESVRLVMERKGSLLVDPAKVHGVAKRLGTLAPAMSPDEFAVGYLRLRHQGITSPNAERVAESVTATAAGRRSGMGPTNDDHWGNGGQFR